MKNIFWCPMIVWLLDGGFSALPFSAQEKRGLASLQMVRCSRWIIDIIGNKIFRRNRSAKSLFLQTCQRFFDGKNELFALQDLISDNI